MMRKLLSTTAVVLGLATAPVVANANPPFVAYILALSYDSHSETPNTECMYAYIKDDLTGISKLYAVAPQNTVSFNAFNQARVIWSNAWASGNSLGFFPTGGMVCGYPELNTQVSYDGTNN